MGWRFGGRTVLAAFFLQLVVIYATPAQTLDEFYRAKQIKLIVGNAAGADYDLGARLLARHMPRHLAGHPAIVVQNMPGAASIGAANYVITAAPSDGTVFGSVSRNLPSQAVIGRAALK